MPARILTKVVAPVSSTSGSETADKVELRTVVAAESEGDKGLVGEPAAPSGLVGWPIGESGCVGGLRETVAFGRAPVLAKAEAGAVADPSGAFAVLRAMVGAPIGAFDVASLMVGVPVAVGVGASGLVAEPEVGLRGMVGAPVAALGIFTAAAVGVSGMVGVPVGVRGLIGRPGDTPPGPAVLIGIVGAGIGAFDGIGGPPAGGVGAFGGPAIGAVVAAVTGGRGVLPIGEAAGIEVLAGGAGAACAN
jgi:hypothetical protein